MQLSPITQVQPWDFSSKPYPNTHYREEIPIAGRSRRQHRSCDQCRKGKRACNVTLVNYPASNGDNSISPTLRSASSADADLNWSMDGSFGQPERSRPILTSTGPCSNCAKTGKSCTLDWLRSVHGVILQRCKRGIAEASGTKSRNSRKRQASTPSSYAPANSTSINAPSDSDTAAFALSTFLDHQVSPSLSNSRFPTASVPSNHGSDLSDFERLNDYLLEGPDVASTQTWPHTTDSNTANLDFMPFQPEHVPLQRNWKSAQLLPLFSIPPTAEALPTLQTRSVDEDEESRDPLYITPANSATTSLPSSYGPTHSQSVNGHTPSVSQGFDGFTDTTLDPLQQRLSLSTNQTLLTNGLLRIYHDSMENALSCWLTEKTCPYGVTVLPSDSLKNLHPQESMSDEWGSNWSNRIFARVCRLDRVSSVVRGRSLTQSEEKLASKALHLAIMSFATQWAQSSNRSAAKFSSFDAGDDTSMSQGGISNPEDASSPPSTEFDRSIQESFWYQARRALQDSAEIDSFRVIFAHIIFSLTQRPLDVARHVQAIKERRRSSMTKAFNDPPWSETSPPISEQRLNFNPTFFVEESAQSVSSAGLSDPDEVTELEGPPIFLETALRQIFSYRCKLENIERQRAAKSRKSSASEKVEPLLSAKDRKTFDLLFWLAIMFDTLSAAMNKRPLVVSDEDSDIRNQPPKEGTLPSQYISQEDIVSNPSPTYRSMLAKEGDSKLWGDFLLRQKHLRFNQKLARWPCTYEDAASTLCDAAPIKVLLFRKVTHLQTLISRRVMHEKLEQTILDALQVYQHWNNIYNQFVLDCIAHHDDLPPRIQSWYVVLAGHWHLAALLLADIIEVIDDGQMGLESQQAVRHSSRLVSKLREQNANVISDLGRCSSPGYNLSFSQAREFHFAVSEGALLTEPWTVVLIRAFNKAGHIFLERLSHPKMSDYDRGKWLRESEISQVNQRCGFCIRALWNLGKKSDMAFLAATALSTALQEVTDSTSNKAYMAQHHSPDMDAIRQCSSLPDEAPKDPFPFVFSAMPSAISTMSSVTPSYQ